MHRIIKVKEMGEPVQTMTTDKLKKTDPVLYGHTRGMKLGDKRLIKIREQGTVFKVGVHLLHPRELSPKGRKKICGPGLVGEARRRFIEEGITLQEQIEAAKLQTALHTAQVIQEYRDEHPEEYMSRNKRKEERRQKRLEQKAKEKGTRVVDIRQFVTPSQIAEEYDLTPLEVRKFLRAKNIGKRGGRYAFKRSEAARIGKAAVRYYEEKEEE